MHKKPKSLFGLRFALNGISYFFTKERNAKIHLIAAITVIVIGFFVQLDRTEWLWIALSITLVFVTEMINSSIEILCNLIQPEKNEWAKKLKDISAGSVLMSVVFSLVVAAIVILPKLIASLT